MTSGALRHRVTSVRFRAAAAATMVVAVTLLGAGVAFVLLQRSQLEGALTDLARQQAGDLAARVRTEGVADAAVAMSGGEASLAQVVSPTGVVLAASPSIAGEPPVVDVTPEPGATEVIRRNGLPVGEEEPFVVVAQGVDAGPEGSVVVIVAHSLESVERSTSVVAGLLALGYPLILVVVGSTSYWLTGRALAPVERMRQQVATVGDTRDLAARVPVPRGQDEVARLAQTMNAMLGRLEESAQSQQRFVGDASHELRSPLASIRAAHEIAVLHPEATDWARTGEEVLAELDRLDRLVADLLLLARSQENQLHLHLADVDLDDIVQTEALRLRRSGLRVATTAPPTRVYGDPHYVGRCIRNLTDNAGRHAHRDVRLVLSHDRDREILDVFDDGPGIPREERERVFERFVRLDQSRARHSGGTGLGLAIARQIARAHGGDVEVVASTTGAHLRLWLPAATNGRATESAHR